LSLSTEVAIGVLCTQAWLGSLEKSSNSYLWKG
jgi:hypothetical protein